MFLALHFVHVSCFAFCTCFVALSFVRVLCFVQSSARLGSGDPEDVSRWPFDLKSHKACSCYSSFSLRCDDVELSSCNHLKWIEQSRSGSFQFWDIWVSQKSSIGHSAAILADENCIKSVVDLLSTL